METLDADEEIESRSFQQDDDHVIEEILCVGTSARGARDKSSIAWNQSAGEFHSGQVNAKEGYTYWLMKFDGMVQTK